MISAVVSQTTTGKLASSPVEILILVALLSVLPGALLAMTGFTRILIVLGFVRNALGTPQMPPTQILVGLAFFLSLFVMSADLSAVNKDAIAPYRAGEITQKQAITRGLEPLRTFMFKQTRDRTSRCSSTSRTRRQPQTRADVPTRC